MSFVCAICSNAFTTNDTEHALYSTKCGHLMGKSCLERWARRNSNQGGFSCPVCREPVLYRDCHPIYDIPEELLKIRFNYSEDEKHIEDDILNRCILGTLEKGSSFLIETGDEEIDSESIKFFDVHNGFILIAGNENCLCENSDFCKYFLKVYKGVNIIYDRIFVSSNFTAVGFNKFRKDAVEFCVGFENGVLQCIVLPLTNGVPGAPNESVYYNDNKRINSICFLKKGEIVYSVGKCNIFYVYNDETDWKKDWLKNVDIKLNTITNLNSVNDHVLLGIMDGKIYVFEKNKTPYVFYSEENTEVINFTYDSVADMILIVKSSQSESNEKDVSHVLGGVSKIFDYDNAGNRREIYISYPVGDLQNIAYRLPKKFKPTLTSTKDCERYFIYSFVPNVENGKLQVHFVNDALKVVDRRKITCFDRCKGIFALGESKLLLSKVLKIQIVLMYETEFTISNYYSLI
uniref:RING-type domain-containing protein n=1 Tax=Strongyloides papillosus TaxID=174720 RepID=A0A0N5BY52_STREA